MKRLAPVVFTFAVFACSDNASNPDSGTDASVDVAVDTFVDPNTPYEHAVLASQWQTLPAGPSVSGGAKQDDVFFLDAMNGWIASGPNSAIYKTTDGGATWTKSFTHAGTYFRAILFTDAMHGFAGNLGAGLSPSITDTNVLYATTDGGVTWNPVTTITGATPEGICNLTAVDATHIFGVGRANQPAHLIASSDGGATWTATDLSATFMMVIDARFTSATEGWIAGMDVNGFANVAHTADAGKTFDTVFTSKTPNSLVWKISFPSDQVGYVAVQDATQGPPTFAKTTDGGKTWTESPLPQQGTSSKTAYPAIGVGFITENVGWMSPEDPKLPTYVTTDGGQTWNVDPTLKSPVNRFRFVDKNTAYAIGASVWKLTVTFP
jgi:photosystem II stability/assembly factor-like uncharacterized protein